MNEQCYYAKISNGAIIDNDRAMAKISANVILKFIIMYFLMRRVIAHQKQNFQIHVIAMRPIKIHFK